MQSYYLRCQSHPKNCLWTDKYQPKMAMEVCGNLESVTFLSEWLHLWYERNSQNNRDFAGENKFQKQGNNGHCSQSDSDYEGLDGENSLKNVLLVTGSSGSGKSAAIYACAEGHGFKVFEFSASVIRSGAVLKQMIGEVLHSHQLKWAVKSSQESMNEFVEKSPSLQESTAAKYLANEVIDLIPLSDDDSKDSIKGFGEFECMVACTNSQGDAKPLILLEDVDIILEDRGFISSIKEIADTGKGPIILTSNSSDPVLPANLDRLHVSFIRSSSTELLGHLYMICASEGVNIQPCLLERIIHCYHKDIRKSIMHLQFWCQDKVQKKYGSLLFDLDAGYQILPVIMPWSFPSQLSELVDKEITELLLRMEPNSCLLEASKGEFFEEELQNGLHYQNCEDSYVLEAKKVAMLSRNGSIHDHNEFSVEFDASHECSDPSGTPIPLSRQKRRRLDMVVSSDSEDEPINKECSQVPNKDENMLSSHHPAPQNYSSPLHELLYLTADTIHEDPYPCSETVGGIHVNGMSMSVNTSCVPESSFVPETEIYGTELFSKIASHGNAGTSSEISVNEFFQNVLSVEANSFDSPTDTVKEATDVLENTCNIFNLSHQERGEFSFNGPVENIMIGYPVMDECSRVDFNKSKYVEQPELKVSSELVHGSWEQLRLHHLDLLRHHVTLEKRENLQILELVQKMSHLISDSDLLISSCQPQDILERPRFVSEEPDSFCWEGQQLQMASTISQHGFCFFANDIATTSSSVGFDSRWDIVSEMLASATNTAALGKLTRLNMMESYSSTNKISELRLPVNNLMPERDMKSRLFNAIQSVAPGRSYLALKGGPFFEYLSTLRCISRSETSRISKGTNKTKRRRGRVARHYLSTGSQLLSPEDIALLGQSNLPYKDIS